MLQQPSWTMLGMVLAAHAAMLLAVGSVPLAGSGGPAAPAGRGLMQVILTQAAAPVALAMPLEASLGSLSSTSSVPGTTETASAPAPLLPVLGVQEAHYRLPRELSQGPQLIHDVAPDLSYLALPAGPVQSAVLRLYINEQGDIDQVRVLQSQLTADVEREVQKAYVNLKFLPGRVGEVAVKSQLKIEVRLENSIPDA